MALNKSFLGIPLYWSPLPTHVFIDEPFACALLIDEAGNRLITSDIRRQLTEPDLNYLSELVLPAMQAFPSLETPQWDTVKQGALHPDNHHISQLLGSCFSWETQPSELLRAEAKPLMFWDLPLGNILDCHWIALRVCMSLVLEDRKEEEAQYRLTHKPKDNQ